MAFPVTFDTVLTLVQQLSPQERMELVAALTTAQADMIQTEATMREVTPEVRHLLQGMTIDDLIVAPRGTPDDMRTLLRTWRSEDGEVQQEEGEQWDEVLAYLHQCRDCS